MKRKLSLFSIMLMMIFSCCLFTACKNNDNTTYTISFESNGGSIVQDISTNGKEYTMPTDPTKEGYSFTGWYFENTFENLFEEQEIDGDITLYAKWTPLLYTIYFYSDNNLVETKQQLYNEQINTPNINKDHYSLAKWDIQYNHEEQKIIYTASWEINSYSVNFYNGNDLVKTENVVYGQSATAPILQKKGHILSWSDEFNCISSNLDLYAVWEKESYQVVFKIDNKVIKTESVKYEDSATAPNEEKEGYSLNWDKDFSSITESITINGSYTPINTLINLYVDNELYKSLETNIESDYLIDLTTINNDESIYLYGWYYNSDLTNEYSKNDKFKNNTSLYAKKYNVYEDGFLYSVGEGKAIINGLKSFMKEQTEIVIPREINSFPVTTINAEAFKDYTLLKTLVVTENVEQIYTSAFSGCNSLTKVIFDKNSNLKDIGQYAFYNCTTLQEINLPSCLERINHFAFQNCKKLENVELGENLNFIGQESFKNCESLEKIDLTKCKDLSIIDKETFYACTSLSTLILGDYITNVGINAFAYSGITELTLNKNILELAEGCFSNCSQLNSVYYNCKLVNISNYQNLIFYNIGYECNGTSVTIGKDIASVPKGLFRGYTFENDSFNNIISVEFETGSTCTKIESYAFENAINLDNVVLPNSILEIEESAFLNCENLSNINLDNIITFGSHSFENTGLTNVEINSSNVVINYRAFYNCKKLEEILLDGQITTLGQESFAQNENLKSIYLKANIENFVESAFNECKKLTCVFISTNITLKYNMFYCLEGDIYNQLKIYSELSSMPSEWTDIYFTIYWYSEYEPTDNGLYWHYINDEITIWE